MQVGSLFKYRGTSHLYRECDGAIGIVLSKPNSRGQYRTRVGDHTLWLLRGMMEVICE